MDIRSTFSNHWGYWRGGTLVESHTRMPQVQYSAKSSLWLTHLVWIKGTNYHRSVSGETGTMIFNLYLLPLLCTPRSHDLTSEIWFLAWPLGGDNSGIARYHWVSTIHDMCWFGLKTLLETFGKLLYFDCLILWMKHRLKKLLLGLNRVK
jgi:hypothetical protein